MEAYDHGHTVFENGLHVDFQHLSSTRTRPPLPLVNSRVHARGPRPVSDQQTQSLWPRAVLASTPTLPPLLPSADATAQSALAPSSSLAWPPWSPWPAPLYTSAMNNAYPACLTTAARPHGTATAVPLSQSLQPAARTGGNTNPPFAIFNDCTQHSQPQTTTDDSRHREQTILLPRSGNMPLRTARTGQSTDLDEKATTGANKPPAQTQRRAFKPMLMVYREDRRHTSACSSNSTGGASSVSVASMNATTSVVLGTRPPPPLLSPEERCFRRQQGISFNYRGDIHNPHNRSDLVPPSLNTSLFLMGLPPTATVGDLLRAVAAMGPTGRVFAASVNPPDPARGLVRAAAKISLFSRAQAELLKAHIDAGQLVMADPGSDASTGSRATLRACWNRDRKPPRRCAQPDECRVLRIRGPCMLVRYGKLAAFFDDKCRYELQDVRYVTEDDDALASDAGPDAGYITMEWRFASFQSQAIAAKMALNQEQPLLRVTYGRDPCEYGEV